MKQLHGAFVAVVFVALVCGCARMGQSVIERTTEADGSIYEFQYQADSLAAPFGEVKEPTHALSYEGLTVNQDATSLSNQASAEFLQTLIEAIIRAAVVVSAPPTATP